MSALLERAPGQHIHKHKRIARGQPYFSSLVRANLSESRASQQAARCKQPVKIHTPPLGDVYAVFVLVVDAHDSVLLGLALDRPRGE